jgi:hypothetical protein
MNFQNLYGPASLSTTNRNRGRGSNSNSNSGSNNGNLNLFGPVKNVGAAAVSTAANVGAAAVSTAANVGAAAVNAAHTATNVATNAAKSASAVISNTQRSPFLLAGGLMVAVALLVAVYWKTVGYYISAGMSHFRSAFGRRDDVTVQFAYQKGDVPKGAVEAPLAPPPGTDAGDLMATASDSSASANGGLSGATRDMSSVVASALPAREEVFAISRDIYTYEDAPAVCKAYGAELATLQQVQEAHKNGADWCNYGWIKGQMAVFPTQDKTWEMLQKGPEEQRNMCGRPGVNGGYWDNPKLRFGVVCHGNRPPKSTVDESQPPVRNPAMIAMDQKVAEIKRDISNTPVLPFSNMRWNA